MPLQGEPSGAKTVCSLVVALAVPSLYQDETDLDNPDTN